MTDRALITANPIMDIKTRLFQLPQPRYSWCALNQHGSADTSAQGLQSPAPQRIPQDIHEGSSSISRAQQSKVCNPESLVRSSTPIFDSHDSSDQRLPAAVGIWSRYSFSPLQACLPTRRGSFPLPLLLSRHEANKQIWTSCVVHIKRCALLVNSLWDEIITGKKNFWDIM